MGAPSFLAALARTARRAAAVVGEADRVRATTRRLGRACKILGMTMQCTRCFSILAIAGLLVFAPARGVAADRELLTIGSGAVTGVYYPAAGAICRLVNKGRQDHGYRCVVESTEGSVFNINAIRSGKLDLALAQSDVQAKSFQGEQEFAAAGPFEQLRALFSLHAEAVTVVARADAGIGSLDDLKGKRVNIGNPGSGQRGTMQALMVAKGWTHDDFRAVSELQPADQFQAMCDGKLDAVVFTVGHPNGSIQEATTTCDSILIPVAGPEVNRLVEETSYFTPTTIPGGMYRGTPQDVPTFGVRATLVTTATLSPDLVYQVVRAVFEQFEEFQSLHPAFSTLVQEDMIRSGNTAPTHEGATKYFQEAGLWPQ